MTTSRKFLLIIPVFLLTVTTTLLVATYFASKPIAPQVIVKTPVIEKVENGFNQITGGGYKSPKDNSVIFSTGIVLGALVILELILTIDVVVRKSRSKKELQEEYLNEQHRQISRGMLLGRLDSLLDRYSEMVDVTQDSRMHSDKLLLSRGDRK